MYPDASKPRRCIFKKSRPSPARPRLEPRTHLTRLHRLRLLWLRARSPILKRCGTSFPCSPRRRQWTQKRWLGLGVRSAARSLPRHAAYWSAAVSETRPYYRECCCLCLEGRGQAAPKRCELHGFVMRVVSAAQGELTTTLADELWTAILTPSSFQQAGRWDRIAAPLRRLNLNVFKTMPETIALK